jgi:hypothetical protein
MYSQTYQVTHGVKIQSCIFGRQKLSSSKFRHIPGFRGHYNCTIWETDAELFYIYTYQVIHRVKRQSCTFGRQKLSSYTFIHTRSFIGLKGQSCTVWETEADLFYSQTYQVIHRIKRQSCTFGRQKLSSSTFIHTRSFIELRDSLVYLGDRSCALLLYIQTYKVTHRVKRQFCIFGDRSWALLRSDIPGHS